MYAYNTTTAYIHMPTHLYYIYTSLLNLQYVKCMLCVHVYMCVNGGLLALVKCIEVLHVLQYIIIDYCSDIIIQIKAINYIITHVYAQYVFTKKLYTTMSYNYITCY